MDFSLIVPSYNEAGNLPLFYQAVRKCFDPTGLEYELIFVDDGSSDNTLDVMKSIANQDDLSKPAITIVSFSRNFGKEAGIYAGLKHVRGTYAGIIDADLQQRPETALQMLEILANNPEYDCVAAVQEERKESALLKFFKGSFYKVFNMMGNIDIPANASDFRVFRKEVAQALVSMPENFRFSKGLFAWIGFNTHTITYKPQARHTGTTHWSFRKLMGYALGGIISFSTSPLRLAIWIGLITAICSTAYLLVVLFETLFIGNAFSGYPTIVCLILLFGGIQMLTLGIMGEYIGRIYIEGKHRPIYLAREVIESPAGMSANRYEGTR